MTKIIGWLIEKFQHPLSPLFFVLGSFLLLLGISNGINIPNSNTITTSPNFRGMSLVLGVAFCLVSILLYYRPPKGLMFSNKLIPLPQELTLGFNGRRAALSEAQGSILNFIVRYVSDGSLITFKVIQTRFKDIPESELIYRLEHLRFLGFLERHGFSKDTTRGNNTSYKLSDAYQKELGNEKIIREARISTNNPPRRR